MILYKKQLFDLEVKGQDPTKVITVCNTPPYGHAPHTKYHWPISRQKCYGPDKKILFKKQLFDLEVKDQGPTKVIMVRDTPPDGHAHTNYLPMNSFVGFIWIIWPWGQRSRSHEGHYHTRHTALWSCTHIPIIIDLSRKTKLLWPGQENTI
jgi:hypothetical protein